MTHFPPFPQTKKKEKEKEKPKERDSNDESQDEPRRRKAVYAATLLDPYLRNILQRAKRRASHMMIVS